MVMPPLTTREAECGSPVLGGLMGGSVKQDARIEGVESLLLNLLLEVADKDGGLE